MRRPNAIDLELVTHPGLFKVCTQCSIYKADRRKILYSGKTKLPDLLQKEVADHEWICGADAGQNRSSLDGGEDFVGHFLHDLVRIAVRHEARERTASRHAKPPGIINHNQVDARGLFTFC